MRVSLADVTINDDDSGTLAVRSVSSSGATVGPTTIAAAAGQTLTATAYSATYDLSQFREALLLVNVTAISGTSPTFDVNYQISPDNGVTWYPMYTTTSQTAVGKTGKTLAASQGSSLGNLVRLEFVVGGTTPSVTFDAYLVLKP